MVSEQTIEESVQPVQRRSFLIWAILGAIGIGSYCFHKWRSLKNRNAHTAKEKKSEELKDLEQKTPATEVETQNDSVLYPVDIQEKALGLLLGTAIGDAKGIAYERLTRLQIVKLRAERNDEKVLYPAVPSTHPFIPKNWIQGRWTDDTQLTKAMIRALVTFSQTPPQAQNSSHSLRPLSERERDLINLKILMNYITQEHVKELEESTAGWGGTKDAIQRIKDGGYSYLDSGNLNSAGNGVVMKISPLALYYCRHPPRESNFIRQIETICNMTHRNIVAVVTALTHTAVSQYIFSQPPDYFDTKPHRKLFLEEVRKQSRKFESMYEFSTSDSSLSNRIEAYIKEFDTGLSDEFLIERSNGGTHFCVDSLLMVYGIFAQQPPSFASIVKASQIGGDTDSNAAMVGALVGGLKGSRIFPNDHIAALYQSDELKQLGMKFGLVLSNIK